MAQSRRIQPSKQGKEEGGNPFQFMLDFDDMYSKALRDSAPDPASKPNDGGLGDAWYEARTMAAHVPGVDRKGGFFDPDDERYNKTVDDIAKGTAIASRYVLPAAGLTLAGVGLYDLTTKFGNAADYPEQQQLTLNAGNVIGTAALGAGVAAAPSIYNEVRDPKFRSKTDAMAAAGVSAAGAGLGALTSAIVQSL